MTAPDQARGITPPPRRAAHNTADSLSAGFICAAESHEDTAQRARRLAPSGRRAHPIGASAPDPCQPVAGRTDGRVGSFFLDGFLPNLAASAQVGAAFFLDGLA